MSATTYTTDTVWSQFTTQVTNGGPFSMLIDSNMFAAIGNDGLNLLAQKLCNLVQGQVSVALDPSQGLYHIFPSLNRPGKQAGIPKLNVPKKHVPNPKEKLPRPPNAFILYRQHHHPMVKAKHPTLHNNQISIILGKQWKNEDTTTQTHFKRLAEMLKKKHFEDNPNYQYHPRKPHEKKRRMARKIRAHHKDNEGLLSTSTGIPSTEIGAPGLEDFDFSFDFETTPAPLPEFDTTPAGNVVLTLGDENIDDATFEAMLREYNSTANVATAPGNAMASVLSTEPLGETEEDFHFLTSVLNFDAMAPVDAEVDAAYMKVFGTVLKLDEVWHSLNYQEQGEVWDDVNRYGWQAALVRYVIEKKAPSQLE